MSLQTRNTERAPHPFNLRLTSQQARWVDAEAHRSGQASRAAIIRRLIDQAIAAQKSRP